MKKTSKILLGALLPVSLLSISSSVLFITSCSTTNTSTFDEQKFKENDGMRYMDLTNTGVAEYNDKMETTNVANTLLATKEGSTSYIFTYSDQFLIDWFSKVNDPILSTYYNDQLKEIEDQYVDKEASYTDKNLFQREVLDPTGGTKNTYIYSQLIPKLKQQLSENLFSRDYLGIKTDNGRVIKLDNQDAEAIAAIKDSKNINGASAGTRNNFVFSEKSVTSANPFDKYYADFINFIFEEWTKETLPIITPTVLFKQSTGTSPQNSGLFNPTFFGASTLEGTDSSYQFQWFDPANEDYNSPNASMKYKRFVANLTSYVDNNTGAINIPKYLTDDSSTMLITNGKSCYTDFVTPFAAAAMYNFSSLVFGTNGLSISSLDANSIMKNFVSTSDVTTIGYFALPYSPTTDTFLGDYKDIKSIRETFKVNNSSGETPFIATRDEFGVHIIGIDRYNKIKEAVNGKTGKQAFDSAIVEIQNTILWRTAQKIMSAGDSNADSISLELKSTLKSYYDENSSELIFKYLNSKKTSSNTNNDYLFSSDTIKDGETLIDLTQDTPEKTMMVASLKMKSVEDAIDFINTIKEKMYTLQSTYSTNDKPSTWKNNGLAGVLPYTRNDTTANFDQLTDIVFKILGNNSNNIYDTYTNAKNELVTAINGLNLEPATKTNYFNGDKIGEQVGVSQYEFVNNWNVNQILVKDSSVNDVVNLYNQLWDTKTINDNFKKFIDSSDQSFEKSVASKLVDQFSSNYSISKAFSSSEQKASIGLDFTNLTNLETTSTKWVNDKIQNNKVGTDYSLLIGANSDFQTFLKTLVWLLTPTKDENDTNSTITYSFENLIKVLNEMIENEETNVGYIGWTSESYIFADGNFGKDKVKDFSYKNPALMTNINTYTYYSAPNPDLNNPDSVYYGVNPTFFNSAKMEKTSANVSNGFLGFQSSSTTLTTSSLPSDLYSGKLLTLNTANANDNFTGLFYRFNNGNDQTAKDNMKKYCNETNNIYELNKIARQIKSYGLGILSQNIDSNIEGIGTVSIGDALTMISEGQDLTNNLISLENRKKLMDLVIDKIPDQAFKQIKAQNLYTSDLNNGSTNLFVDSSTTKASQYVVTQFNKTDIDNFEKWVKETTSKDITQMEFANMDISTFFSAIVLLAQNSEVQSRSSTHWSNISKEKKIIVYNYLVAQKLGESVVENWDDFK